MAHNYNHTHVKFGFNRNRLTYLVFIAGWYEVLVLFISWRYTIVVGRDDVSFPPSSNLERVPGRLMHH